MWLLDVETMDLVPFLDDRKAAGKYAILSHPWYEEKEEVSFQELKRPEARLKKGYRKIEWTCEQAKKDDLSYAWVDTCCINKESSAELSEAINSMYRWYQNSKVCYVYLADLHVPDHCSSFLRQRDGPTNDDTMYQMLHPCRWFERGWTLQELIALSLVQFFDCQWKFIHDLKKLAPYVSIVTNIPWRVLAGMHSVSHFSLAARMSWAARRKTSRREDEAYCLLGLLGVTMPLLYGEGARAFTRLQEELIRNTTDQSILAWLPHQSSQVNSLLASDIYCFRHCTELKPDIDPAYDQELVPTSRGLRGYLPILDTESERVKYAVLNCTTLDGEEFIQLRKAVRAHNDSQDTSRAGLYDRYTGSPPMPQQAYVVVRDVGHNELDALLRRWHGLDLTQSQPRWEEVTILREPSEDRVVTFDLSGGVEILSCSHMERWYPAVNEFEVPRDGSRDSFSVVLYDKTSDESKTLCVGFDMGSLFMRWSAMGAEEETSDIYLRSLSPLPSESQSPRWNVCGGGGVIFATIWRGEDTNEAYVIPGRNTIVRIWRLDMHTDDNVDYCEILANDIPSITTSLKWRWDYLNEHLDDQILNSNRSQYDFEWPYVR